jgi:hypothetical protein
MTRARIGVAVALAALSAAPACGRSKPAVRAADAAPRASATDAAPRLQPRRVAAIGDLHGDLDAARAALKTAGAIDDHDHWAGGDLVVVQLGDQIDRGDQELELLEWLARLEGEAAAAGGALVVLDGNHELMNAAGDFRYVTAAGYQAFGGPDGRRAAFAPGGAWAKRLAAHHVYAIVGDTLFAHGGVLPAYAGRLEAVDDEARAWLRGETTELPAALVDDEGPLWTRAYGGDPADCDAAKAVLDQLGLRRMVVAHTYQEHGANAVCDGRVWRVDVGLARFYGGPIQVLEIAGGDARVLTGTR